MSASREEGVQRRLISVRMRTVLILLSGSALRISNREAEGAFFGAAPPVSTVGLSRLQLFGRIAAALLGGYAFTWGFMALVIAAWFAAGLEFHDGEMLAAMLGFLLFLVVFLWAFAARSQARVWIVLLVGAGVMTGLAFWLQAGILARAA